MGGVGTPTHYRALTTLILDPLTIRPPPGGGGEVLPVSCRWSPGFFAPVSIGAIIAALAVGHACAQSLIGAPASALRPTLDDSEDAARRDRARQAQTRRPLLDDNRDNPSLGRSPSLGVQPGSGASTTGYNSFNISRRRPPARAPKPGLQRPSALTPLTPAPSTSGAQSTAARSASARAGTTSAAVAAPGTTPPAAGTTPAGTAPITGTTRGRALVRVPDGPTNPNVVSTVDSSHLLPGGATLLRRRTAIEDDPFAPTGVHAGTFYLRPAIEVTGGYDTNPARTPGGKSSSLLVVSPELLARSDWSRHELTAALRGSYTTYGSTPQLDRPAFDGKLNGRIDVTRDTQIDLEGRALVGTDSPGSPNIQADLRRFPIFTTIGGTAGVAQRFNRIEVALKGTIDRTDYQDSQFTDGTTGNNADRNYFRYGGALRTSYDLMPGLRPFVEVAADTRNHDVQVDRFGLERDSVGWSAKAGSTFEFTRKLTGEVSVGYLERSYKDPTLPALNGILVDGALIYSASALTNVKLIANTQAAETTIPGVAGVLTRNAGVEVEHAFRRWLIGAIKFNYGFDDYIGSDRKDNRYAASAAITYKLNREMQVRGEFRQEWMNSTQPGVDYVASVFLVGMRLQR